MRDFTFAEAIQKVSIGTDLGFRGELAFGSGERTILASRFQQFYGFVVLTKRSMKNDVSTRKFMNAARRAATLSVGD